jgi:hypothetical protein
VKVLLDTLQLVTEFEAGMSRKWGVPVSFVSFPLSISLLIIVGSAQFQQIISHTPLASNQSPKAISSAFEPHTGIFVDAQDKCVPFPSSPLPRP